MSPNKARSKSTNPYTYIFSRTVLTIFGIVFVRFSPSSPVDTRRFCFTAPRTQRILFKAVRVLKRVCVSLVPCSQHVVIDDWRRAVVVVNSDSGDSFVDIVNVRPGIVMAGAPGSWYYRERQFLRVIGKILNWKHDGLHKGDTPMTFLCFDVQRRVCACVLFTRPG